MGRPRFTAVPNPAASSGTVAPKPAASSVVPKPAKSEKRIRESTNDLASNKPTQKKRGTRLDAWQQGNKYARQEKEKWLKLATAGNGVQSTSTTKQSTGDSLLTLSKACFHKTQKLAILKTGSWISIRLWEA